MNKAIYPGSFDPITFGHLDIIERCSKIYDKLIVGVIKENNNKKFLFDEFQRKEMIETLVSRFSNVEVKVFDSLLVDFAVKENSKIIIRGLRAVSDFEYEFQLAGMNKKLSNEIETVFLMSDIENQIISSNFVKEIAKLGGKVDNFLTKSAVKTLKRKINE